MNNYDYLYTANYVIYNLAGLCIVIASVILFSKRRTFSTILILTGGILTFLIGICSIFINAFAGRYDTDTFLKINAISNIASGLTYFIFCIGLLLFVINDFNKVLPKNEFLD